MTGSVRSLSFVAAALATGRMLPTFAALGYSSTGSGEAPRGAYGADLPSRQQVVMTWIFGYTPEGVLTTVLQTPTGGQIPAGGELTLGHSAPRKLPCVNCDQQCREATVAMDAAFIRDATAARTATAALASA